MTRPAKKREPEVELRPDGWERFKRAVAAAGKVGPKHRKAKESPKKGETIKGAKSGT